MLWNGTPCLKWESRLSLCIGPTGQTSSEMGILLGISKVEAQLSMYGPASGGK